MQPLGDMTFDHVITKLRTLYLNFRKKYNYQTWLEYMITLLYVTWFIITRFLYSYILFLYVIWSRNLLKLHSPTSKKTITTKRGANTYKNERVAYPHMAWVNHAKVIKDTALKVALMKDTNLNRQRDFWFYDILTNEKSISNFYKSCQTSNLIEKNTEDNKFIL